MPGNVIHDPDGIDQEDDKGHEDDIELEVETKGSFV